MSLDLTRLIELINEMPAYRRLTDELRGTVSSRVTMLDAAKPYLIAALYSSLKRPLFIVMAQPEEAKNLAEQLATWCHYATPRLFPEPDALPYQRTRGDAATELERLEVLSALAGFSGDENTPLVITSIPALMQKVVSYHDFTNAVHTLKVGQEAEPLSLLQRWETMGYKQENLVEVPGTMSHRGGILDIYPPSSSLPARLEFFGDAIESIRFFDPVTQRSQVTRPQITITPATELLTPLLSSKSELEQTLASLDLRSSSHETREQFQRDFSLLLESAPLDASEFYTPLFNNDSIVGYLPPDTLVILNEPQSLKSASQNLEAKASELRTEKLSRESYRLTSPCPTSPGRSLKPRYQDGSV